MHEFQGLAGTIQDTVMVPQDEFQPSQGRGGYTELMG